MRRAGSPNRDLRVEAPKSEAIPREFAPCGRWKLLLAYRVQALVPDFLYSESYPNSLHFARPDVIVAPVVFAFERSAMRCATSTEWVTEWGRTHFRIL
jgi:hypothetical protein